jgi:hypothetical protein
MSLGLILVLSRTAYRWETKVTEHGQFKHSQPAVMKTLMFKHSQQVPVVGKTRREIR